MNERTNIFHVLDTSKLINMSNMKCNFYIKPKYPQIHTAVTAQQRYKLLSKMKSCKDIKCSTTQQSI